MPQPGEKGRGRWAERLKGVVFVGLVVYLGSVLWKHTAEWPNLGQQFRQRSDAVWWAALLISLTPINQLLEARKWQVLLRPVAPVSLRVALRSVLAGLSLGLAIPVGDVAGRVLSLQQTGASRQTGSRQTGILGATLLAGGVQYYVALVFGSIGWGMQWLALPVRQSPGGTGLLMLLLVLVSAGIGLALLRHGLMGWLAAGLVRWPKLARWANWFSIAADPSDRTLAEALSLAAGRHLVFSAQFYASMRLFGLDLAPVTALAGIWVVYLTKTVAPALNLFGDLGVREVAALWAFGPFSLSAPTLLAATLTLWLVNVAIPVAAGLPGLWQLRKASITHRT